MAGLVCLEFDGRRTCQSQPANAQEIPTIPVWDGTACGAQDDAAVAYFEVPRDGKDTEFYRLPYPNDIRVVGGRLDLRDHPRPPDNQIPIAARFIEAGDGELTGFGTNPVAYFRFSEAVDGDSLMNAMELVDITPGSPTYDEFPPVRYLAGFTSNYICPHAVAVRRPIGQPLRPKTTYAAIVTTKVRPASGGTFARSPDFEAMLADKPPSDKALTAAYEAYAPLRAWIEETGSDESSLLNVAVFTTMDPEERIAGLAGVIEDARVPRVSDLTECGPDVTSPCETQEPDGPRGSCHAASDGFVELHGRIRLPVFQEGDPPYLETGGAIATDSDGTPEITDETEVCFALAIPDGDPPADGWPLLIYGHGTGGSFAGAMGSGGIAEAMADGDSPAATLALDMPMHGERRAGSKESPETLFFNIINPQAARGNVLQGSADLLSLLQFAARGSISQDDSPTGDEIHFDAERIAIMGHSQGATHAAMMLSYSPILTATVLSGVGGHLVSSLLNKSKPVAISEGIGRALFDTRNEDLAAGDFNPAMSLIQQYYDSADPINVARRVHLEPTSVDPDGSHLFMTYGLDDHYSPEATQQAYAHAADLTHVGPVLTPLSLPTKPAPATATVTVGGKDRTIGLHQYEIDATGPDGQPIDGHFVAIDPKGPARPHVIAFLHAVMAGQVPAIGAE